MSRRSVHFLWCAVLLTAVDLPMRVQATELDAEDWAKRFGTEQFTIRAQDWKGTIEQLGAALKTRVVTLVPARWEPRAIQGTPAEVLKILADAVEGKWIRVPGALGLFPARRVKSMDFDAAEVKGFIKAARGEARLVYSLTPTQRAVLSKGERIQIADLTEEQRACIEEILKRKQLAAAEQLRYFKEGQLGLSVSTSLVVFWRGVDVNLLNQIPRAEWKESSLWRIKRQVKGNKLTEPTLSPLSEKLFAKQTLEVAQPRLLELHELEGLLTPLLRKRCGRCEFCVSARLRKRAYVLSAGTWTVSSLLTALEDGDQLELRWMAEEVAFLTFSRKEIDYFRNLENSRECELSWRLQLPALESQANNPRNELGPFAFKDCLTPRLLPLLKLPREQRDLADQAVAPIDATVFQKGGQQAVEAARATALKAAQPDLGDMECYVLPMLRVELWLDNVRRHEPSVPIVFNYGWVARYTK
jgi:hypothetical protein